MNFLEARHKAGFTQEQLAREIGVTMKTCYRWEKGVSRIPSHILPRLQEVLGLSDSEVLGLVKQKESA